MPTRIAPRYLILLLPALLAAVPRAEAPGGDLAKLQGEWTVKAGPKRDIPVVLTVRGSAVTVDLESPLGLKIHAEGRVKLDETTSPKRVDWVGFSILDGQDFPDVQGLYELRDDTFRMVNGGPNDARPTEFKKGDGALADVLVFKKADHVAERSNGK